MTRTFAKALVAVGFTLSSMGAALAQNLYGDSGLGTSGWDLCIDPDNQNPKSNPYIFNTRANDLSRHSVGGTGTVTYGGQNSPCWSQANTYNIAGRIGFASGPAGSMQSTFDDDMQYTFGMPLSPAGAWSYINIMTSATADGQATAGLYQGGGNFYAGESGRYIYSEGTVDNVAVVMVSDTVGDATRVHWTLTNLGDPQFMGLWYGAWTALLTKSGQASGYGSPAFVVYPGHKPLFIDHKFRRSDNPALFPKFMQFVFSQEQGYGMQVDLGPTDASSNLDGLNSDATEVDAVTVGEAGRIIGDPVGSNDVAPMPDTILPDVAFGNTAFISKYEPASGGMRGTNEKREIVAYFRDTWGNSKYVKRSSGSGDLPYSAVVDAPHILANDTGGSGTNGLATNPFTVRVYIDNVGGFSGAYQTTGIDNIRVTLTVGDGFTIDPNSDDDFTDGVASQSKTISHVNPFQIPLPFVDFPVQADGIAVGDIPYTVKITSTPGPNENKPLYIDGTVRVSATPKIVLQPAANLISIPWMFFDSSLENILGLDQPSDFTAYNWDPQQQAYVVATSAQRGVGTWVILNPNVFTNPELVNYIGAQQPTDTTTGAPNSQLHGGWNLIGDPYQYAIPVSELVGVSQSNPGQSYTFPELVSLGIVSPYLAYYDPAVGNYRYVQGFDAELQPNRGYWIKVLTAQDLTIVWPAVYDTFIPSGGNFANSDYGFASNKDQWRVQIQAATATASDTETYFGKTSHSGSGSSLRIYKPPFSPSQGVYGAILGSVNGQNVLLGQSIYDQPGQTDWTYQVQSKTAGTVTLRWPNVANAPRDVTLLMTDNTSHQTVNMRMNTTYTYTAAANSTRTFTIKSGTTHGGNVAINNLMVSPGRLGSHLPAMAKFTLNMDANVTIKVRTIHGVYVATVTSNQAMSSGYNTSAWNLKRDNGSYVSPGQYKMEVTATANGQTVTKTDNFVVYP